MNVPLNIDWQQILLHLMNFAILAGGLYLLLYKPVKQFMAKREAYYQGLADQAADKLREAEALKADCQAKLDASDEEIRQKKAKAQHDAQVASEQQLDDAKVQAQRILADARQEAERDRQKVMSDARQELKDLVTDAAEKLARGTGSDAFDLFLDLAEKGPDHEKK